MFFKENGMIASEFPVSLKIKEEGKMPFLEVYSSVGEALRANKNNREVGLVLGIEIQNREAFVSLLIICACVIFFFALVFFWTCIAWSAVVRLSIGLFLLGLKHWRLLVIGKAVEMILLLATYWVFRNWKRGRFLYRFIVF